MHVSDWVTEVTPMLCCSDSIAKMLGLKSHLSTLRNERCEPFAALQFAAA